MPTPLYLTGAPDPVFAIFHAADEPLDTAVVICPPFGWEDMCSYRGRREWAQRLAGDGYPTLRIDLPGTGDSAGSPREADLLATWTAAVAQAADWLSARPGNRRVVALGIGLGGLLAIHAAQTGAAIDDLVLWSVPARGRKLVREMRAFSQMEDSQLDGEALVPAEAHTTEDGSLAVAGYLLSAETVRDLDALDFSELARSPGGTRGTRRALLLERDGRGVDERLSKALQDGGAEVTVQPGEGYARMMMAEPQDAVPATGVFEQVSGWLAEQAQRATPAHAAPPVQAASAPPVQAAPDSPVQAAPDSPVQAAPDSPVQAAPDSPAQAAAPAAHAAPPPADLSDSVELELPGGTRVRETALTFAHPFGDPFGILTEPLDAPRAPLCAVWLNAGPQRRSGPNRMWVELARRWAAQGVPSLRLDLAGIGDAGGDHRPLVDARAFFVPDYIEQVELVLDALQARGLPPRFLVGGLCSGGYWAFQMALHDQRALAALMLNPGVLVFDGGISRAVRDTRALWRNALKRSTWRRVLRGDITISAHLRTARVLLARLPVALWQKLARLRGARDQDSARDEIDVAFDRLQSQGARAVMIFAGEEHIHEGLEREGQLARLQQWPNLSVSHIALPLNLHTLRPLWLQHKVHELLDAELARELDRPTAARATT